MIITYTAKREIEPLSYFKSGTDISAAAGDDSFNATSTVLTGLLNDEFFLVAGFANDDNNGWFEASASSTATKISQDSTTSLVTEAAGPTVSIQGYRRGLGVAYSFDIPTTSLLRVPSTIDRSASIIRKRHRAIGGAEQSILKRIDVFWKVMIEFIEPSEILQWREFLASVANGEPFTFDAHGSLASPDDPITVVLDSDDYDEGRHGATRLVGIPFRVREV